MRVIDIDAIALDPGRFESKFSCEACGHEWFPKEVPDGCPRCGEKWMWVSAPVGSEPLPAYQDEV